MQQANRELNETAFKLQGCKREQKRAELTNTEVEAIDDSTPMYRSIGARGGGAARHTGLARSLSRARACVASGKMFLLSSKPDIKKHLSLESESHAKTETDLMVRSRLDHTATHTSHTHIWPRVSVPQARKTYLERKINSLQLNLRELIGGAVAASN